MKKTGTQSLPVVMYHYVNRLAGSITISPERFDEHCRVLAQQGLRGVGLEEAEAFLIHGEPLPEGSVLLSFDDGFLDNYVHALPALKRHGHKAVIFAVSSRLEKGDTPRLPLEQVLEGRAACRLEVDVPVATLAGINQRRDVFLNHAEARLIHEEGTLAVASHSRGHYGVFIGPDYKDVFRPRPCYRTFYRTEIEPVFGLPDFTVKAGLAHRAFVPNPDLVDAVKKLVPQDYEAAVNFFANQHSRAELDLLLHGFAGRMGDYETETERSERIHREIVGGKQELEAILGQKVKSLCWPWGRYDAAARDCALEAGFELLFTTKEGANPPGKPLAVHRFKGKNQAGAWLANRVRLYSRPLLGTLYARIRL
ncbi:polysaccharide deacetylase family protein [Desulfovibrio sp. OttesenSCG-928-M16]|nr:polysaccharide deacetylase family protein [Desulfovibrio sp. OttesenSCG-928-M16]